MAMWQPNFSIYPKKKHAWPVLGEHKCSNFDLNLSHERITNVQRVRKFLQRVGPKLPGARNSQISGAHCDVTLNQFDRSTAHK